MKLGHPDAVRNARGMSREYLDVMTGQQPCQIVTCDVADALDLGEHVPGIALQISGRPHPFRAEVGIADVACQRERPARGLDLEPLDAEAVSVACEAADDATLK